MTFADLVVIAIIAISVLFSFFFGFVWEVLFFASWVGAALAAYFGFPHVSPWIEAQIGYGLGADIVSAVAIFIAALVILMIVTQFIAGRVRRSGAVSIADRLLGILFGAARGALVVIALWLVIDYIAPDDPPETVRDARSLPLVKQAAETVLSTVPQALKERARAAGDDARDKAGAADDMMDAGRRLGGEDETPEKGYPSDQRREFDRLFDGNTNDR